MACDSRTLSATLAMTSIGWGAAFYLDGLVMALVGLLVLGFLLEPPLSQQPEGDSDDSSAAAGGSSETEERDDEVAPGSAIDQVRLEACLSSILALY